MNNETHRFFLVKDKDLYESINTQLDISRGFPNENTTRSLTPWEGLIKDADGYGLVVIDKWRFTADDEAKLSLLIENGFIIELSLLEFFEKADTGDSSEKDLLENVEIKM
jgi:hypothetical protein